MKDIKQILEKIKEGTSVEDIMLMLKEAGISPTEKTPIKSEEEYAEMLESKFKLLREEYYDLDEPFWAYENFFPNNEYGNKDVGGGAWIKVKTDIGYNVYWAKRTKKQFNKTNIERKIQNQSARVGTLLNVKEISTNTDLDAIGKQLEKAKTKMDSNKDLCRELMRAEMLEEIGLQPYCVKYRVSKTKWVVAMPHEYDLAADIELYVKTIGEMGKTEAITYKTLFTSVDKDIVFYLQSRGIAKDMAIMMSKLKDCYFICNVNKIFEMAMQPIKEEAA